MRALLLAALIALPSVAFAANTTFFGPIVPQCPENGMCRACDLVTAADNLLKFLIALSVFAAAIMFAYAGFLYITAAASPKNIDSAKNIFWKVFLGLIIVLIAWIGIDLILRVFTGSSLSFYSNIRCVSFNSQSGGWDVPRLNDTSGVQSGGEQDQQITGDLMTQGEAEAALAACGVTWSSSGRAPSGGYCSDQTNSTCTSLQGIPRSSVLSLCQMKRECNCTINVTGGTEIGHSSHGFGKPNVDIAYDPRTARWIFDHKEELGIRQICTMYQDRQYRYNCDFEESQRHLHITF